MEGLGRAFDIGVGWVTTDMDTNNGETGKRINVRGANGLTIVLFKGAGTAGADPTVTLKQHTAYTSGTSADAPIIDHFYKKVETALDNDESWVKVTQTAAATIGGTDVILAEAQAVIAIPVDLRLLTDGYTHVSLDLAVTAANPQLAGWLYILHDLHVRRTPANLGNLLRPGAANA